MTGFSPASTPNFRSGDLLRDHLLGKQAHGLKQGGAF